MPFLHHCTACDRNQLIFPSQGTRAEAFEDGLRLTFVCWCGDVQARVEQSPALV